jgi:hypothetical protein
VHSYIKRREFSKTKNKSGKQKNVMNEWENRQARKRDVGVSVQTSSLKKSKLKYQGAKENLCQQK